MSDRTPITIRLVDNHEYSPIRDGGYTYLDMEKQICIRGGRNKARWDDPWCWESLRLRVADAIREPRNSRVFILRQDGYSHDTEDDFVSVNLTPKDYSIRTGNLVGSIVRLGAEAGEAVGRVSIGSRFGDVFLKYIIADADGFLAINNHGGNTAEKDGYEWLLGYLWNVKFKSAYRLGVPKCYVTKREVMTSPRGQIDTVGYYEYSKRGRVRCTYREMSYDNPAAALFAQAWKILNGRSSTRVFCGPTANICQIFEQATGGNSGKRAELLSVEHFTNAFYGEYNKLIDLSKVVLKHWGSDFTSADHSDAILFDVSMLFEYYLRKLLKRRGFMMMPKEVKYLRIPTGVRMRGLIPDLVFKVGDGLGIFDVKYKRYHFEDGVSREDLFQLHTYIGQYGNKAEVKACGFIYPILESSWRKWRAGIDNEKVVLSFPIRQQKSAIDFCVCFLVIPEMNGSRHTISEFKNAIDPWVSRLTNQLGEIAQRGNGK